MPTLTYRPRRGGSFFAPTLQPGQSIEVSAAEAEHLLATGVFDAAEQSEPEPSADVAPTSQPAKRQARGR